MVWLGRVFRHRRNRSLQPLSRYYRRFSELAGDVWNVFCSLLPRRRLLHGICGQAERYHVRLALAPALDFPVPLPILGLCVCLMPRVFTTPSRGASLSGSIMARLTASGDGNRYGALSSTGGAPAGRVRGFDGAQGSSQRTPGRC